MRNDGRCLWWDGLASQPRAQFEGDQQTDIAIIGGGFTGLWTAWFLKQLAPSIDITLLEARHCGHGASGRNGGWLMGGLEGLSSFTDGNGRLRDDSLEAMRTLVEDVAATLQATGIDCDLAHGGSLSVAARFPEQVARAQAYLKSMHALGFKETDYHWLSAEETAQRVKVHRCGGAVFSPHVATINPMKLVSGLAQAVERAGVRIYENSPATCLDQNRIETPKGLLTSKKLVLATEGYTDNNSPIKRALLPVQSGMIATEPLSDDQWQTIGLFRREALCDFSRASTYIQRSRDNRLVVGARGAYQFGAKSQHALHTSSRDDDRRQHLTRHLFPQLGQITVSHRWGGSLAIPRSFAPAVIITPDRSVATAGGYLGEGVGASFLFGRTLAELLLETPSSRAEQPWVQHSPIALARRPWEPEPLPWLGFNATMTLFDVEDRALTHRHPRWWRALLAQMCDRLEHWLSPH